MANSPGTVEEPDNFYNNSDYLKLRNAIANKPINLTNDALVSDVVPSSRLDEYTRNIFAITKADQGDQEAINRVTDGTRNFVKTVSNYIQGYTNRVPVDVGPPKDDMTSTAMSIGIGGKRLEDYSAFSEIQMNETAYQELAGLGVNPNRSFDADTNAIDAYKNPLSPEREERLKTSIDSASTFQQDPGAGVAGQLLANQLDINENSPWRLKSFFNVSNPNPFELYKMLRNDFPNLKQEDIQFLDPKNKTAGLGIYVPKLGVEGENGEKELIPLRPQFGVEQFGSEVMQDLGNNTIAIALETGGMRLMRPVLKTALKDAAKQMEQQATLGGKIKRGASTALLSGTSVGLGRIAQLAYGKAQGVNDVNLERAFDDAGLAALFAAGGTAAIGTSIGIVSGLWSTITGNNVPQAVVARLHEKVVALKKGSTVGGEKLEEFTSAELIDRVQQAAKRTASKIDDAELIYQPSVGELTQDPLLQQIEHDLWTQLSPTSAGKQAYERMLENNDKLLYEFWKELTEASPNVQDLKFADFEKFIKDKRKDYLNLQKNALNKIDEAAESEAAFDNFFPAGSNEPIKNLPQLEQDRLSEGLPGLGEKALEDEISTLGGVFTQSVVDEESPLYRRNTPALLAERDSAYLAAKSAYDIEADSFKDVTYVNPSDALNKKLIDPDTGRSTSLSEVFKEEFPTANPDSNEIIIGLDKVLSSKVVRNMIPMNNGVSVIKQLAGIKSGINKTTGEKEVIPELNLTFSQMKGAVEALEAGMRNEDNPAVIASFIKLRNRFEMQANDLLIEEAKKAFRLDKGIPDGKEVAGVPFNKWLNETNYFKSLQDSHKKLLEAGGMVDRKWLKQFVEQPEDELSSYILSDKSTINQTRDLLSLLNSGEQASLRVGNLQKLTIESLRKTLRNKPIKEQNELWIEFKKANEEKLKLIFPRLEFDKLIQFENFQKNALINIAKRADEFARVEEILGEPVQDFLTAVFNKQKRMSGDLKYQLEDIEKIRKQFPSVAPVIDNMFRERLRELFENPALLNLGGTKGPAGTIFDPKKEGIDINNFLKFVGEGLIPGEKGTQNLGRYLGQILGKDVGPQYAKDLRMLGAMFQKGRARNQPTQMSASLEKTLDDWLATETIAQRFGIAPLSPIGRKVTAAVLGFRTRAKGNLLEILLDPKKARTFVENKQTRMNQREVIKFIGALIASNEVTSNMGSDTELSSLDREIGSILSAEDQIRDMIGLPLGVSY